VIAVSRERPSVEAAWKAAGYFCFSARNCLMCGWGRLDMHAVSLVSRVILVVWGGVMVQCCVDVVSVSGTGAWAIVGAKGVRVGAG